MRREFAQVRGYAGDSWMTSASAGANFYALLGLMCAEMSRFAGAVASLLMTVFYAVQVTARLVEWLLDAWIEKSSAPDVRKCIAACKTMPLVVVAAAVWWTYHLFVTRPILELLGDLSVAFPQTG